MHDTFRRSVLISTAIIAGSFIAGIIALVFINARLGERVKQIVEARRAKERRTEEVELLAVLKESKPKAVPYQQAINLLLPRRDDLFGFGDWLENLARVRNVSIRSSFQGEPLPSERGVVNSVAFTATVAGTQSDVLGFLEDLEPKRLYRFLVKLDNYSMVRQGGGDYSLLLQGKVSYQ